MSPAELDQARQLAEELRSAFAEERRAIAKLDNDRLAWLAEHKRQIVSQLEQLDREQCAELRPIFAAIQIEARATAMLASTAAQAVRAVLGRESHGYDRRARLTETERLRLVTTY